MLSFAQFEREVIGERVRDKIAASKTKGLWVGGPIPLGYRSEKKQLLVVDAEAAQVRHLFQLYLALGSIGAVAERLHAEGIVTRRGYRYRGGALAHLLKNRFYLGQIAWRGALYTGAHTPIVDGATFDAVQARLASGAIVRRAHYASSAFTLCGLLYDDAGYRMTPSHTRKRGVRYRYYVSQAALQHHKGDAGVVPRVCAPDIEAAVSAALRNPSGSSVHPLADRVSRVTLTAEHLLIDLIPPEDAVERVAPIKVPFERIPQGRRKGIAHEPPQRLQLDQASSEALLSGIGRARIWMNELVRGTQTTHSIALRDDLVERHVRRLLPLACLSPTIIRAIADGTARAHLTITALTAALPHDWVSQEQRFMAL